MHPSYVRGRLTLRISGGSGTGIGVTHDSYSREILDHQVFRGVGIRERTVRQWRRTVLESTSPSGCIAWHWRARNAPSFALKPLPLKSDPGTSFTDGVVRIPCHLGVWVSEQLLLLGTFLIRLRYDGFMCSLFVKGWG